MYNRNDFVCEQCGKRFNLYELDYDELRINDKTGWTFPIKYKTQLDARFTTPIMKGVGLND